MELFSIRIQRTFQLVSTFHVYTCIEKGLMKELHCYVCVCKSNKWLIDSKKRKWGDDTKWSNIYL